MRSLVNYYKERYIIYEEKFKNLNVEELAAIKELLKSIMEHDYDLMKKGAFKRIPNKIEYGHKYFVEFRNPFADDKKYTSGKDGGKIAGEEETVQCIGIADKFGRIFLHCIWDEKEPAYIEYRKEEYKVNKAGKKYLQEQGWFLTRKDIEAYKVQRYDSRKIKGAWGVDVTRDIFYIKDLNDIPKDVEAGTKRIEAEAEQLRKEEENRKFWADRKDYEYYGFANGWKETPAEVKKAMQDKDAKWFSVKKGREYYEYWCDKYKLYYAIDSTD